MVTSMCGVNQTTLDLLTYLVDLSDVDACCPAKRASKHATLKTDYIYYCPLYLKTSIA